MPVSRQGRRAVAVPEELTRWVGTKPGRIKPVHIASKGEDLASDPRRGLSYVRAHSQASPATAIYSQTAIYTAKSFSLVIILCKKMQQQISTAAAHQQLQQPLQRARGTIPRDRYLWAPAQLPMLQTQASNAPGHRCPEFQRRSCSGAVEGGVTLYPVSFLRQYPTGGAGISCLRQIFARPTSERPNCLASVRIGVAHTFSYNSARVRRIRIQPQEPLWLLVRGRIKTVGLFRTFVLDSTLRQGQEPARRASAAVHGTASSSRSLPRGRGLVQFR